MIPLLTTLSMMATVLAFLWAIGTLLLPRLPQAFPVISALIGVLFAFLAAFGEYIETPVKDIETPVKDPRSPR